MTDGERTRRDLLRTSVGAATAAGVGGLAGCTGSIPGLGGDGGVPDYARWVPSLAAFGTESGPEVAGVRYLDVAGVLENGDSLDERATDRLRSRFDELIGFPSAESVDSVVGVFAGLGSIIYVAEGSFSASEVEDAIGPEATADGEYAGYTLYSGGPLSLAVADGASLVLLGNAGDPRADLETVIDAERGEAERLAEADDDVAEVLRDVGTPVSAVVGKTDESSSSDLPNLPALEAFGYSTALEGDTARLRSRLVYEDADAVDRAAIEEATAGDGVLGIGEDASVSTDGRTATVTATTPASGLTFSGFSVVPTEAVAGSGSGSESEIPTASFQFEYDEGGSTVTITHQGGDTFDGDNTGALRYGIRDGELGEWSLPAAAGDSVTVEGLESGDTVTVVWESPGGDRSTTVAESRAP